MNTESHSTSQPLERFFSKTDLSYAKSWPPLGCHVRSGRSLVLGYVLITVAHTGVAVSWMASRISGRSSASLAHVYRWTLSDLSCHQVHVWSAGFELVNNLEGRHVASADAQAGSILQLKRFKT